MGVPKFGKNDVQVLKGIIRSTNSRAVTVEEMNQAIAAGAAKTRVKTRYKGAPLVIGVEESG
jgi:hypothetical protein